MKAVSSEAKQFNLNAIMAEVDAKHEPLMIQNQSFKVVMLSLEEYESLNETAYLLKSPRNAERLLQSLQQDHENQLLEKDLDV